METWLAITTLLKTVDATHPVEEILAWCVGGRGLILSIKDTASEPLGVLKTQLQCSWHILSYILISFGWQTSDGCLDSINCHTTYGNIYICTNKENTLKLSFKWRTCKYRNNFFECFHVSNKSENDMLWNNQNLDYY